MNRKHGRPKSDTRLVQIVDAAISKNAHDCGDWLVCRPGCWQCCVGVFEISQLDAVRLREGLEILAKEAPQKAAALRERARKSRERLSQGFPGDVRSGLLNGDDEGFADFANDEVCPVLDPETRTCDLYGHRPMTCRVFGPPVRTEDGLGHCELCFEGAPPEQIALHELIVEWEPMESTITRKFEKTSGQTGKTLVAWALVESK